MTRPPRLRSRLPRALSTRGMTLIEILVVVVIIAIASTGISFAVGALTRTKLRSACLKVVAASRFAYNRAVSHGTTVRLVFDIDKGTLAIEEAHGRVTLARADSRGERRTGDDSAGVDPWEAAQQRLSNTFKPSFGASPFAELTNEAGEAIERFKAKPLGPGIRIVRIHSPHEPAPRQDGRGAIYYFSSGMTEHTVIQLAKTNSEAVYSVEIHPLTGRGRVHNFAFEPEPIDDDAGEEELSEVEDER